MLLKSVIFCALLALCKGQSKTQVFVYFESLCPDSAKFINDQLYPTMKEFKQYVDLRLVPFGKSSYITQGSDVNFTCHHGPNECYGNKVLSCAIEHIQVDSFQQDNTRETLTLSYVDCLMRNGQLPGSYPGERCAKDVGLTNWGVISNCANTTEGSKLLQRNGDLTKQLQSPLMSVPTIAFKQTYESDTQSLALVNLRKAICGKLSPAPVECRNIPGSNANSIAAVSSLIIAGSLISFRLL